MHFAGPGDYNLEKALPPGTDCFQCELAPSGHMVIPCCEYSNKPTSKDDGELTLVAKQSTEDAGASMPPGLCPYQ